MKDWVRETAERVLGNAAPGWGPGFTGLDDDQIANVIEDSVRRLAQQLCGCEAHAPLEQRLADAIKFTAYRYRVDRPRTLADELRAAADCCDQITARLGELMQCAEGVRVLTSVVGEMVLSLEHDVRGLGNSPTVWNDQRETALEALPIVLVEGFEAEARRLREALKALPPGGAPPTLPARIRAVRSLLGLLAMPPAVVIAGSTSQAKARRRNTFVGDAMDLMAVPVADKLSQVTRATQKALEAMARKYHGSDEALADAIARVLVADADPATITDPKNPDSKEDSRSNGEEVGVKP